MAKLTSSLARIFNRNGHKNLLFMVIWITEMCFIKDSEDTENKDNFVYSNQG